MKRFKKLFGLYLTFPNWKLYKTFEEAEVYCKILERKEFFTYLANECAHRYIKLSIRKLEKYAGKVYNLYLEKGIVITNLKSNNSDILKDTNYFMIDDKRSFWAVQDTKFKWNKDIINKVLWMKK